MLSNWEDIYLHNQRCWSQIDSQSSPTINFFTTNDNVSSSNFRQNFFEEQADTELPWFIVRPTSTTQQASSIKGSLEFSGGKISKEISQSGSGNIFQKEVD